MKIESNSPGMALNTDALDEEGQIAVSMHQQAQKDRAEARVDRRSARRDEIKQMHKQATELRKMAAMTRAAAVLDVMGSVGSLVAAVPQTRVMGEGIKVQAAVGRAINTLGYNDKDMQANIKDIEIAQKGAQQRAEAAQDDIQQGARTADSAKDLLQKLTESRIRSMQIATRD